MTFVQVQGKEPLNVTAQKLYKATIKAEVDINMAFKLWAYFFTRAELEELWKSCQENLDLPYDDEVFEALKIRRDVEV